ncbi:MAG: hypothetical protein ABSB19_17995 [Methylomonas sp.]|jgi:hypothetical protein
MTNTALIVSSLRTIANVHGYIVCRVSAEIIEQLEFKLTAKDLELGKLRKLSAHWSDDANDYQR